MEYNWAEIRERIYFIDGSLRDIYINNITKNEWELWVNYVNKNYKIDWNNKNEIDFEIIKNNWKENIPQYDAKIFIENIQINNHFFSDFENDIDPNEIKSVHDHNCIIKYMKEISEILNTTIYLSGENWREDYLIKIYKNEIYS